MKTKTEIAVMCPSAKNAKDGQQPSEARREKLNRFLSEPQERNYPSQQCDFGPLASKTVKEQISVCYFKPLGLWYFVRAA